MLMGYPVDINQELENPLDHQHEKVLCDITVGNEIGFRWNAVSKSYELVADLQTWNDPIPPERFLDKITQQYAIEVISEIARLKGYEIEEQKVYDKQQVELTLNKWN